MATEYCLHAGQRLGGSAYERLYLHARNATDRRVLDFLAFLLGFSVNCLLLLGAVFCCLMVCTLIYWTLEGALGYQQVEITSIEASSSFPTSRFNLTARVVNHSWNTRICFKKWEADVWYSGTRLGKA